MKKLFTLLLMVTIQITFMQKVMASAPLLESDHYAMSQCMESLSKTDSTGCITKVSMKKNCQNDCDMMTVVSVTHFIENEQILSLPSTLFNYPYLSITPTKFEPSSLYRPPLVS